MRFTSASQWLRCSAAKKISGFLIIRREDPCSGAEMLDREFAFRGRNFGNRGEEFAFYLAKDGGRQEIAGERARNPRGLVSDESRAAQIFGFLCYNLIHRAGTDALRFVVSMVSINARNW
jgi:hypothetical protein